MQWIKMLQLKGNPYVSKCFPNDLVSTPWVVQGREFEGAYRLHLRSVDFPELQLCLRCGMTLVPGVGALSLGEGGWKNGSSPSLPQDQCVGSLLWTANWSHLQFHHCSPPQPKISLLLLQHPVRPHESRQWSQTFVLAKRRWTIEGMKAKDAINTYGGRRSKQQLKWKGDRIIWDQNHT